MVLTLVAMGFSALLFGLWFKFYMQFLKKPEEMYAILLAIPKDVLYVKMESIQKFYSFIFQKQLYSPDPKIKNIMSTTVTINQQNQEDILNRKMSFNEVIRKIKTTRPGLEQIQAVNEAKKNKSKKIAFPLIAKFIIAMIGLKFIWLVLVLLGGLLGGLFSCSSQYQKITENKDRLSFMRFYILELNTAPKIFTLTDSQISESSTTHPVDQLLNHRNQILESLYSLNNDMDQDVNIYLGPFKTKLATFMSQNITDQYFKDNMFVENFFVKNIVEEDIGDATFSNKIVEMANKYVQQSPVLFSQITSLTDKGLKYLLLSNINVCDYILKSQDNGTYNPNNKFFAYLESMNLKLLFIISYSMEMLSALLKSAFDTLSIVHAVILNLLLVFVLLCIAIQLKDFYITLKREIGYAHYVQNNILNFIEAETIVQNDEIRTMMFSLDDYFKVDF